MTTSVSRQALASAPRLRHRLEALLLACVVAAMAPLSVDRASWLMGKIWRHGLGAGRRHRRSLANLALVLPEVNSAERRRYAAAMRENLGRVFIEAFRLGEIDRDGSRYDLSGAAVLKSLAERGDGVVLASLHMGNWEAATAVAMRLGIRPAGVYRHLSNPIVEQTLVRYRAPFYPLGLFCKRPNSDVARKLLHLAKNGGSIAIMADLREDSGVAVDFLGAPSSANPFPAFVARMTGRPLVAARLVRTHGVHFRAEAIEIAVPHSDDRSADIAEATRRLSAVFEDWIRQDPTQWLWTHRKWELPAGGG